MDTTIQYIKMCREAKEIQRAELSTGDFFYIPPYANCGTTGSMIYTDDMRDDMIGVEFVFLPRQDQLQELLSCEQTYFRFLLEQFYRFCFTSYYICSSKSASGVFVSLEQLWLGYVMKNLFKKYWNGSAWVT